jgi:hypothetical protein
MKHLTFIFSWLSILFCTHFSFAQSTILWHRSYDSGTSDQGNHISFNSQGSVFVAGVSKYGPTQNILSLKYDSTGTLVFGYKCNPELPGNLVKIERAVNSNIYALSSVELNGGDLAYSVSKYTPSGTFRFQYNSGDSINYRFTPIDIAVDIAENVVVAGTFEEYVNRTKSGFFIKQISATGADKWTKIYSGLGKTEFFDLTIDNSSNVYVCGTQNISATSGDFVVQKYNANGVLLWSKTYNGSANLIDKAEKIVVDNATGNVFVAGIVNYNGNSNQVDNVLLKYNSAGSRQWQRIYGHTGSNTTKEILLDASGNSYVVGNATNYANASGYQPTRIFTAKFSSGGTQQWLKVRNNGNFIQEIAKSAVIDLSGNIFVGAETKDSASFVSDMLAYKLSNTGIQRWQQKGDGIAGENDFVSAIVIDNQNNVYLTGNYGNASNDVRTTRIADKVVTCQTGFTQMCYLNKTRCYANNAVTTFLSKGATFGACVGLRKLNEEAETVETAQTLIFPNPTNNIFNLHLANSESCSISVIDLTGREVAHFKDVSNKFSFGAELVEGIYLVKVSSQLETKIMKVIKRN